MLRTSSQPILTQHFDTPEVAFAKIDEELASLKEGIRDLHAFRNTHTPIYRLPPEILTLIFSFVQLLTSHWGSNSAFKWIVVTHVSQHWRNVATGNPALWSCIPTTYPKNVINEWLKRSKGAALSLNIHRDYQFRESVNDFVLPHIYRLRDLSLHLNQLAWRRLLPHLSSPAPLLESLFIRLDSSDSSSFPISDAFFAGITPRLRDVELDECSVNLASSIFANLTALSLREPPQKLSSVDVLNTIRKLPHLTLLYLNGVLRDGDLCSSGEIITLSSLEELRIYGQTLVQDLNIMSYLRFPARTAVHFASSLSEGVTSGAALVDYLTVHKATRGQSPSSLVHKLSLSFTTSELSVHISSKDPELKFEPGYRVLLDLSLTRRWEEKFGISTSPESSTILSLLPIRSLTSFEAGCNIEIGIWTTVFGSIPNLKHIKVVGKHGFNILSAIIQDFKAAHIATDEAWVPIFPRLKTLMLKDAGFPACTTELVDALRARSVAHTKLDELKIKKCTNVNVTVVNEIREWVDTVRWNQGAGDEDDSDDD